MQKLQTFDDVLALWETPKALSDDLGTLYVTAQLMKHRRSIGVDHWPRLIELLKVRGYTVTTDDLMTMRAKRAAERREEREAAA
jgi:hypothetical protein